MKIGVLLREMRHSTGAETETDIVLNPLDEYALEAALELRDRDAQATVTAVVVGPERCQVLLRTAAALGVNDLLWIPRATTPRTSEVFATAVEANALVERWDLILGGREDPDWRNLDALPNLAGRLEWPMVLGAETLGLGDSWLEADVPGEGGGRTVLAITLPAVVTLVRGPRPLRKPDLKGIMAARRKEIRRGLEPPMDETLGFVGLEVRRSERKRHIVTWNQENKAGILAAIGEESGLW